MSRMVVPRRQCFDHGILEDSPCNVPKLHIVGSVCARLYSHGVDARAAASSDSASALAPLTTLAQFPLGSPKKALSRRLIVRLYSINSGKLASYSSPHNCLTSFSPSAPVGFKLVIREDGPDRRDGDRARAVMFCFFLGGPTEVVGSSCAPRLPLPSVLA